MQSKPKVSTKYMRGVKAKCQLWEWMKGWEELGVLA